MARWSQMRFSRRCDNAGAKNDLVFRIDGSLADHKKLRFGSAPLRALIFSVLKNSMGHPAEGPEHYLRVIGLTSAPQRPV